MSKRLPPVGDERVLFEAHGWQVRLPNSENPKELYIKITDTGGKEIVYWSSDEWQEDPMVTVNILTAVIMLVHGSDILAMLEARKKGR